MLDLLDLLDLLDDFASTDKATDVNHLTTKPLGTRETNPIYRQHIDKWKDKANTRIMKLLEELKLKLEL